MDTTVHVAGCAGVFSLRCSKELAASVPGLSAVLAIGCALVTASLMLCVFYNNLIKSNFPVGVLILLNYESEFIIIVKFYFIAWFL